MSYEVLARKWRPQSFADLVGQTHVVKALTYALSHQQIHHAYLFTGTRGVGKTSIARIFAKSLNCEVNGVSATPCGQCTTCHEITAGRFVDLIEVDAASRTGVEETRELIESVAYLPSKGRYKVYLIDEVHMFSKSSFNALLKTLEEPPEHVKFILATTDPEKLPITILSRCLQFNLKSLTPVKIRQHLANICSASDISYDDEALALLANAGDGSMRDTLSMTDQAIAYGHGELRSSAVRDILGTIQPNDIEAILFAIATNNPNQLSQALHRLDDYEVDARAFLIEVMRRLQRMAWAKEGIVDNLSAKLLSTVNDIPKELLHLWYDIAEKALPNLSIAGEPRQAVEMALLRMVAFIPDGWTVRHRTLLETDTINIPEAPTETLETANQTPLHLPETTTLEASFAERMKATPVAEHDSLDAAEAQFSGEPTPQASLINETLGNPETNEATETPANEKKATQKSQIEQLPQTTQQASDDNWQLSSETQTQESAPSMDEVRAMMQSGREIPTPPASENPPISRLSDNSPNETVDTPTPIEQSDETPPWEVTPSNNTETFATAEVENKAVKPAEVIAETIPTQVAQDSIDNCVSTLAEKPAEELPIEKSTHIAPTPPQKSAANIDDFDWYEALPDLGLTDYTKHLASLGIMRVAMKESYIKATLDIAPKHELLITDESVQELENTLENHFSTPIKVEMHLTTVEQLTPSEREKISSDKQQSDLLDTFRNEPLTQKVLSIFEGHIIEKTVKPVSDNNE